MPVGSFYAIVNSQHSLIKRFAKTIYYCLYGTPDLHTHIRWRSIYPFCINTSNGSSILDIGCGSGLISIELALRGARTVVGIDIDKNAVKSGNAMKNALGLNNVEFIAIDAREGLPFHDGAFDIVLLIDVIEHIPDPSVVLKEASRVLHVGGKVVISVPTPRYPKFFGYDFHREIGHVRDGYEISEITMILKDFGMFVTNYKYYTWLPASLLCAMFYRSLRKSKWGLFLSPLLNIMSYLDFLWPIRVNKFACSLAVEAKKEALSL